MKRPSFGQTLARLCAALALTGVSAVLLSSPASGDPPRYRIIVIDPPPGVTTIQSFPEGSMGLNNWGEAVGTFEVNNTFHPFLWLPATNLNYEALFSPGTHSLPLDPERVEHVAQGNQCRWLCSRSRAGGGRRHVRVSVEP